MIENHNLFDFYGQAAQTSDEVLAEREEKTELKGFEPKLPNSVEPVVFEENVTDLDDWERDTLEYSGI